MIVQRYEGARIDLTRMSSQVQGAVPLCPEQVAAVALSTSVQIEPRGGTVADYETHANNAQEILDELHPKSFQRSEALAVAAARVQAILALAAAIDRQRHNDGGGAR